MAPPEVFMKEEWRLEISASAYGELSAANPVQSGTATSVPVVRRVCELHVGKAFGQIHGRVRRRGEEGGIMSVRMARTFDVAANPVWSGTTNQHPVL